MLFCIIIISVITAICKFFLIPKKRLEYQPSGKIVDIIECINNVICFLSVITNIILWGAHYIFGAGVDCPFCTMVSSQDTNYSIISFSKTVMPTEKSYIIKVDDNENITYILSDHESNIEVDYQGDNPTTMTITENVAFDYCTFKTIEQKIYKIH